MCEDDLAGAEALESEAGAVVSAASTGPATNRAPMTTGTIFLNMAENSRDGLVSPDIQLLRRRPLQAAGIEAARIMTRFLAVCFKFVQCRAPATVYASYRVLI